MINLVDHELQILLHLTIIIDTILENFNVIILLLEGDALIN